MLPQYSTQILMTTNYESSRIYFLPILSGESMDESSLFNTKLRLKTAKIWTGKFRNSNNAAAVWLSTFMKPPLQGWAVNCLPISALEQPVRRESVRVVLWFWYGFEINADVLLLQAYMRFAVFQISSKLCTLFGNTSMDWGGIGGSLHVP